VLIKSKQEENPESNTFFQKEKYGRIIKTANENERSEIL